MGVVVDQAAPDLVDDDAHIGLRSDPSETKCH